MYPLRATDIPEFSNIQYFTSDEGLSQSEVTCILQDRQGFLWIGTRGGLNRYDGYSFKIFQNEIGNPNSLINNSIECLLEDRNGNIWIGTKSNGLSRYSPHLDRFEHFSTHAPDSIALSGNRVLSLAESASGDIWVGTWENGLTILNPQQRRTAHLLGKKNVNHIIRSRDEYMWIASSHGAYVMTQEGDQLAHYPSDHGLMSALEDKETGSIYMGSWNSGLYEIDPIKNSFRNIRIQEADTDDARPINSHEIYQDRLGRIWIASWGQGLNLYDPQTKKLIRYDLGKAERKGDKELYRDILSVYQDRSGIFWIGTNGGGLCKLDERSNQFGLTRPSLGKMTLPREPIWSILKDKDGVLWVSTKGGKYLYYSKGENRFEKLEIPSSIIPQRRGPKEGAKSIIEDRDGQLWFGSKLSLFKIIKSGETYQIVSTPILEENRQGPRRQQDISVLYQTSDGTFWIGRQLNGLRKSIKAGNPEEQKFRVYSESKKEGSLQHYRVSALLEDKSNRFWIGTYGGLHLYQADTDNFLHYYKKPGDITSLSSDIIICLHEDQKGRLWIGTPNGLNLAIPGQDQSLTFQCYQEKDGLPNNYIHAILEDDSGNLWISTNKGISKFNPEEKSFNNYDVNDGLQSNSFMENVAFKDQEGKFYFGGIRGLNVFHPDSIRNHSIPPHMVLTGLKIFNREVEVGEAFNDRIILQNSIEYSQKLRLSHHENVFSIEYTALDFHAPLGVSYFYKLDGLEEEWNAVGPQRSVTYTNLQPGDYTFLVKAVNNKGVESENEASLRIEILPPFWATWQAFVLYVLIFLGLLLVYRHIIRLQNDLKNKLELARMEQQKEMELAEMKTSFFTNITHELRTPLTLILGPLEQLLNQKGLGTRFQESIDTMYHNTQRLLALVNQLLDFRKAESGNMNLQVAQGNFVKFSREVFLSFHQMAKHKAISYHFKTSHKEIPLFYDRDKLEIVLCNLLSNAFKYTPKNHTIDLELKQVSKPMEASSAEFSHGYCEITIRDSGVGMPEELVEKIFDRFYQIANTDSAKIIGTGIGLSLAKNIVELHKGDIFAHSEMGKGSEFTIRLPLGSDHFVQDQLIPFFQDSEHKSHYQNEQIDQIPEIPQLVAEKKKGDLLIVEDNAEIRAFVRNIFEKEFRIIEAENGRLGLKELEQQIPDLIISDVMMPEMDGISFCQKIRDNEQTAHLPVILLTARSSTVFQVEGYHAGADVYVTKPFQPAVLQAQVTGLLAGRAKMKAYFGKKITLQPTEIEITSREEEFLNQAMKVVEQNLENESFNRDQMAEALAMSSSTLYRKIKALTGLTTNAFIRSIRLKRAAQLMQESQYHISEIAYIVGFHDLKYFRKSFKQQFGLNPSEYLQKQASIEKNPSI